MAGLSLTLQFASLPQDGERFSMGRFREILQGMSVDLEGSLGSAVIGAGSITSDKLATTVITGLTDGIPVATDTLMFHSASAGAPRECTIQQVLDLGFGAFTAASTPVLTDFVFGIVSGSNRKVTIADALREAINGQTALAGAASIDKASDYVLVYDASATAGTNKNRKVLVNDLVQAVTNTIIADAAVASAIADSDQILVNQSGTQKRATITQLKAAFAGMAKAWAHSTGDLTPTVFAGATCTAPNLVAITAHGLSNDDVVWARATTLGISAYTPYYASVVDANTVRLATSKANRAAGTFITVTNGIHNYLTKWPSNPLLANYNVDGVIPGSATVGHLLVDFTADMANANYAPQASGFYSSGSPGYFFLHPYGLATTAFSVGGYDTGGAPIGYNKLFVCVFGS